MIAPDDRQFLTWRAVSARRTVSKTAAIHLQAFNDGQTYQRTALDDMIAHRGSRKLLIGLFQVPRTWHFCSVNHVQSRDRVRAPRETTL